MVENVLVEKIGGIAGRGPEWTKTETEAGLQGEVHRGCGAGCEAEPPRLPDESTGR